MITGKGVVIMQVSRLGSRLYLSAKTVANNVSTILVKLQVTQRGEAIVRAREPVSAARRNSYETDESR